MLFSVLIILLTLSTTYQQKLNGIVNEFEQFSSDNSEFTKKLISKIFDDNQKGKVVFSPLSIHIALAMLQLGTDGKSEKELMSLLQAKEGNDRYSDFKKIIAALKNKKEAELLMGNKLFCSEQVDIKADYKENITAYFNGFVENLNFSQKASSASKINEWVSIQTKEKIKDFIKKEDIDEDTKLIIINALYFKSSWKYAFESEKSEEADFFANDGFTKTGRFTFMQQNFPELKMAINKDLNFTVIELPYEGESLSAYFILPNERININTFIQTLPSMAFENPDNYFKLKTYKRYVRLPKFIIKEDLELSEYLKSLNVKEIFTGEANLQKISNQYDLFVSHVNHAAFLEVNELGTEASATTSVGVVARAGRYKINFDRPFIFFIKDKQTGAILFLGKIEL